jgi:hemerythrin-like domain-containing protein
MGTSPLQLNLAPSAGFEQPFEMLGACHERVERMLVLLLRLLDHLERHGADAQAREAARDLMRYFDLAAPAHHEDEERHVFPRLRVLGQTGLADALLAEHAALAQHWDDVRPGLLAVREGVWRADSAAAAGRAWPVLATAYRAHIEREEREAFPTAAAGLDGAALAGMGAEMAARRGLRPGLSPPG